MDPTTIPHVDDNPDWVDAPISIPTPVFQTLPPVTDLNPVNNQLAEALQQLLENLNKGSVPKPQQSKARILDTFNSSDSHKLNHFLFQYRLFFCANPLQFSTDEEKINFAMTYLSSSTRLVQSRITSERPRLCITLAFHLAPLCGRAPSSFQTLRPSRGCH